MSQLTLQDVDEIWLKSCAQQAKINNKGKTVACPYPYYDHMPDRHRREVELVKVDCAYGKGKWCKLCMHHKRHAAQQNYSRQGYIDRKRDILRSYTTTGLVPHLRRKLDTRVNELGQL